VEVELLCGGTGSTYSYARELWVDGEFKIESAGWLDSELIQDWTGLRIGLTLPMNGHFSIRGTGALEVFIPGKGWIKDRGIFIFDGCTPDIQTSFDTASPGVITITQELRCIKEGNRVLMLVRLPKMFKLTKPTQARWIEREVQYAESQ
jgi:hypothetical protein